ncbi:MAG TPA: DNA starvation/stationary phase protection protein [Rhizomicrobium sp.]|nr:DNA starvation/stationary phase protection protein [Rhizomicrobium sp.]
MAQVELSRTIRSTALESAPEPAGLDPVGVAEISRALNALLADSFALYLKTKNFHWQVGGPRFRSYQISYHLEFDEHAEQLFAATDALAERVRAMGGRRLSLSEVGQLRCVRDNERPFVQPTDMLVELMDDNKAMIQALQDARRLCDRHKDAESIRLLESLVDQAEHRSWFLFEMSREGEE